MQKRKRIYLSLLLILIISVFLITGISFSTASLTHKFSDVEEDDWFLSDVTYVYEKNLMNGTSETTFSPYNPTTRAMIAMVLWRMENSPAGKNMTFQDVPEDAYYNEAVAWCSGENIVTGYSDTVFGPDNFVTREQLATMIYRYAGYKGYDVTSEKLLSQYSDVRDVNEYALSAFEWAISHGIINGTSVNTLSSQAEAQRCQVAAILKRFCMGLGNNSRENQTAVSEKSPQSHTVNSVGSNKMPDSISDHLSEETPSGTEKTDDDNDAKYPIISIDNVTAKPGDSIEVAVNIKNNPGILGMILSVYFNEESLSLEGIRNGTALSVLDFISSKTTESGVRLIWDGVEIGPDDIKDGTIFLMDFKIKDGAGEGKYPITLKYTDGDILDNNLKTITPSVEDGYVTILKGADAH